MKKTAYWFRTDPKTGYGIVEEVALEANHELPGRLKIVERAPGSLLERHNPPKDEVHIVTVECGVLTVSYRTADGEKEVHIGENWEVGSAIFEDHEPANAEHVTRSGHSSIADESGALLQVFKVKTTELPLPLRHKRQ